MFGTRFAVLLIVLLTIPSASALDRSLVVINGLAETLSSVNLETGVVSNNIQTLGLVPNQVFIDNAGRRDGIAYVVNSSSHDLQLIQLEPVALLKTISMGADRNPYSLEFLNDSLVVVSNLLANTISKVNTQTGSVVNEFAVGVAPQSMVYHQDELFVCLTAFDFVNFTYGQGHLAVVDPEVDSVITTIDVGMNPQSLVLDYEDQLLVLCTGDFFSVFGMIYVVDPSTWTVIDSVATGGSPGQIALSPNGHAYIAAGGFSGNGEVYVFDSHTHTMVRNSANPIAVGTGSLGTASDIYGNAYSCNFSVDQVSRIAGVTVDNTYALGDGPGFGAVYEPYPAGDVDESGSVTSADIIFLVNYLFKSGPGASTETLGDVNRNCQITLADAVTLVNHVFRGGPQPAYGCF
jgi:DNA-binding beta-propeller fold protein YncE